MFYMFMNKYIEKAVSPLVRCEDIIKNLKVNLFSRYGGKKVIRICKGELDLHVANLCNYIYLHIYVHMFLCV